jgi:response regulator RpfG family c-di-GMP phosphodiesterase
MQDVVAILDTSEDTVEMLARVLQRAGFRTVTGYIRDIRMGKLDLAAFLARHDPAAIVYDLAPPYEVAWQTLQAIKREGLCRRCNFVLTTPNAQQVARIAGRDQHIHEIIGKPYDLDAVVRAVKEAVRNRPTR